MEFFDIKNDIVFDPKPDAVPYNYRISYKVSQICLIMQICGWAGTCSLIKLHIVSYALMSKNYMENVINFSNGLNDTIIVHFDPAVNRAVDYAVAYGFIKQQASEKYMLTSQGKDFVKRVMLDKELMVCEINRLKELSKGLTEKKIEELMAAWRLQYAKN